jgi:sporulation protein YlmC with PRC-barrel domain
MNERRTEKEGTHMANMISAQEIQSMHGQTVYDESGEKIGEVEDFYYDDQTDRAEWIGIDSGGLFGGKHYLVPVEGAHRVKDGIGVPYSKDVVKDTPDITDDQIDEDQERELYEHYGMRYQANRARTNEMPQQAGGSTPQHISGAATPQQPGSVTRSEEEMHIGKREVDGGTARLKKSGGTRRLPGSP